jgi:cyclohexanecarboxylate-CoA ligase
MQSFSGSEARLRERWYAEGHWDGEPLWETIKRSCAARGDAVAMRDDFGAVSWRGMIRRAGVVAAGYASLGVRSGDAVMIQSRNRADAVIAILACFAGGYLCVPLPPIFSANQLVAVARSSSARLFIELDPQGGDKLAALRAELPGLKTIGPDEFLARLESGDAPLEQPAHPDAPALVLYSSGSTGTPKGVLHCGNTLRFSARTVGRHHALGPDDTVLVGMEFGFVGSTVLSVLLAILAGSGMAMLSRWNPAQALDLIQRWRVTWTLLLSTHVVDILRAPELERTDVSSLRRAILAGLNEDQRKETIARLCPRPMPMYGMSESIGHTTCEPDDPLDAILITDGRSIDGTEMRLVDENGDAPPPGVSGELFLRGPNRCLGYYNAPDLTSQSIDAEGFLRTNDRAIIDARGFMTFQARAKEIIRRGGVTIIPGEVEALLKSHPDVLDVALVAIPDERLVEKACACIIPRPGRAVTLASLAAHLEKQSAARYLWPELMLTMSEFPRTVSLKVRRPDLTVIAREALAAGKSSA